MKKLLVVLLVMCLMAVSAYSVEHKISHLSKLNMTPEEFSQFTDSVVAQWKFSLFNSVELETVQLIM